MRLEHLQQIISEVLPLPPSTTVADIAQLLEKFARSPEQAAHLVGALYGHVFKRKEAALNPWAPPDVGQGVRDVAR